MGSIKAILDEKAAGDSLRYDVLLIEIKLLSEAIIGADKQSNQIEKWCLTLWTGCWGLVLAKHIIPGIISTGYFFTFGIALIAITYAFQDIAIKRNQRNFLWRTRVIHSELNSLPGTHEMCKGFRVYDVAGFGQAHQQAYFEPAKENYEKYISPLTAFIQSTSIKCFYFTIFALTLGLSLVINTLSKT